MKTMARSAPDPYGTLGISPAASDAEVRGAYRRLVQLHHPDHNGGSAEAARRFEDVQEAYAQIRAGRRAEGFAPREQPRRAPGPSGPAPAGSDPGVESRLADLERELQAARSARERARQDAREATRAQAPQRPSDEELGYVKTDDSFARILADAASDVSERLSEQEVPRRVSDLIDELAAKLTGEPPKH
jgi:curved DNA-binding protein CbpA